MTVTDLQKICIISINIEILILNILEIIVNLQKNNLNARLADIRGQK